jgi:hypothetical protein
MSAQEQWINRTEIQSETSNRVYIVSQHATKRFWGCSCPGWRTHRRCKHLEQLGLPGSEEPFEVEKDHAKKKGFLDGYETYDDSVGRGNKDQWQQAFTQKMGLEEARKRLGLPTDAGWDAIRQALHLAATESLTRLTSDYEAAVRGFDRSGPLEEKATAVKTTRFRLEAYQAYLDEQRKKLDAEMERINQELLTRIEAL